MGTYAFYCLIGATAGNIYVGAADLAQARSKLRMIRRTRGGAKVSPLPVRPLRLNYSPEDARTELKAWVY